MTPMNKYKLSSHEINSVNDSIAIMCIVIYGSGNISIMENIPKIR